MRGLRKIVVDDIEYTWRFYSACVVIKGPNNLKWLAQHWELQEYNSKEEWDVDQVDSDWDRPTSTFTTPGIVAKYIRKRTETSGDETSSKPRSRKMAGRGTKSPKRWLRRTS